MAPHLRASHIVAWVAPCLWVSQAESGDRTITQVVKLLQGMLGTSKADGNSDRDLYAKYKCYKDTNEAQKKAEIEELTQLIGLLENKIEELLASTGSLSKDVQQLKRDMSQNLQDQDDAKALRKKENDDFLASQSDLGQAIEQMKNAIETLAEVGADQTDGASAQGHKQFMSDYKGASLAAMKTSVKKALVAASALAGNKQTTVIEAFLQAPFTGTYSAQSGEVVGILKNMRDTFKANKAASSAAEAKAVEAFDKFMALKSSEYDEMDGESTRKQAVLASNDGSLSTNRGKLQVAQNDLSDAEGFLATLLADYDTKTKEYSNRVDLRTKEEAALAEAISILNSDSAFATFGTVDATRTGATSFVQYTSINRHGLDQSTDTRQKAEAFLQRAANTQHSPLIAKIVSLLQAQNPFAVVLKEIDKMISLIAAEEKADDEQQSWCDDERTNTDASIGDKTNELAGLDAEIHTLDTEINDPQTGLLKQEADTEQQLQEIHESRVEQTAERREANQAFVKDVANLVDAEALLQRAIVVLRNYYSKIDKTISSAFVQADPSPPPTWQGDFKGQSVGGGSAIDMLEFILKNTQTELSTAHADEEAAQHLFEDNMIQFETDETRLQGDLGSIKERLANAKSELHGKKQEHKATSKEKAALEAYLVEIKPGCDFITTNLATRKANRVEETTALTNAKGILEQSPAYQEAEANAHQESLGDCLKICNSAGEEHAKCKACLAGTSVPGYCAGHPSTAGCA